MAFDADRLDDADALSAGDSSGMLKALATAGAQVRMAVTATLESGVLLVDSRDRPRSVLVAAMGADDLVGDVVTMLAARHSPVVVSCAHDLPLPGWVGSLDLVLAVSLSGRALGPLGLAHEAGRRGARLITVGAADSPLADAAAQARGIHVPLASDGAHRLTTSRAALWSLLTPAVLALAAYGVVPATTEDLEAAADRLDEIAFAARPGAESFVSPAKTLAIALGGSFPLVLADGRLTAVVARRAGTMLARTARIPSMVGQLPDAAAQLLACLDGPYAAGATPLGIPDIFADPYLDGPSTALLSLLLVRDRDPRSGSVSGPGEPPGALVASAPSEEEARRFDLAQAIAELAESRGTRVHSITPGAGSDLVRMADLIAQVDFATAYLALGHAHDPTTAPVIADLRELRRHT